MKAIKNNYAFVLRSIKKDKSLAPHINIKDKHYVICGGTRGIGYSIAETLALNGAKVSIFGKTTQHHPKLENTIYTAAEQICDQTKKVNCLPYACDIRNKNEIKYSLYEAVDIFGSIDGVVLNSSALCLNNTNRQTEKEVELMSSVNINGTFMFGQECFKHMAKDKSHMIIISPPIEMLYTDDWWTNHLYYSISKFNMSLMAKFWNKEFPNVAVNTLWPRTTIDTAPVRNILGGEQMSNISRTPQIMGDAAYIIFNSDPNINNGKNFIDDEVCASMDIDVEQYRVNKDIKEKDLMPDFFC